MKIVIITQGSLGDVRPFLALGVAFRKRGYEVLVCAPSNFQKLFISYGILYQPIGLDFQSISPNIKTNDSEKDNVFQLLIQSITEQFIVLPEFVKDANLVIGNGFDFAGRSLAEYYKIPYFIIVPMPLAFKSKYHAPMSIPFKKRSFVSNAFFWWIGELASKLVFGKKINQYRLKLGLSKIDNYVSFMSKNAILAADNILAPLPPDCINIFQTGFLDYEEGIELDDKLLNFINSGSAPVYIGFGSMTDSEPEKTSEILQELVQHRDIRFIISKGWAKLEVNGDNINVLFVDHVPHSMLFPKMALIIHHGGAGTTCMAARAGIPQIIIPHDLDQYYWGYRITDLKIGITPINRKKLTSDKLLSAIDKIINDPGYRKNAKEIGAILNLRNGVEETINIITEKVRTLNTL